MLRFLKSYLNKCTEWLLKTLEINCMHSWLH